MRNPFSLPARLLPAPLYNQNKTKIARVENTGQVIVTSRSRGKKEKEG
jgi:hypothetical protein